MRPAYGLRPRPPPGPVPPLLWADLPAGFAGLYPPGYRALISLLGEGSLDDFTHCLGPLLGLPGLLDTGRWPSHDGDRPYPVADPRTGEPGLLPWGWDDNRSLWWAPPAVTGAAGEVWATDDTSDWDRYGNSIPGYLLAQITARPDRPHAWYQTDFATAIATLAARLDRCPDPGEWDRELAGRWAAHPDGTRRHGSLRAHLDGTHLTITPAQDPPRAGTAAPAPQPHLRDHLTETPDPFRGHNDDVTAVLGPPRHCDTTTRDGLAMWALHQVRLTLRHTAPDGEHLPRLTAAIWPRARR